MKRELRSSDFAFLLLIYFLLCSGRGRSRDSGSNRRSTSSPPKGPFGSLPLRRTRVLWCGCPPSVPNLHQQRPPWPTAPAAQALPCDTCDHVRQGAGGGLRRSLLCKPRCRGDGGGWPPLLKWKCGLRRLKGSVPPRIDWLLSITTTFSASSSTFRYAHHYYILLHF
jgi:hypothetical protein